MAFDEASARIHLASVASSSVGQRGLVVETQPLSEWYKDQGGKKALLTCTISSPVALGHPVPLRCTLLLENGTVPEQSGLLEIPSIAGSTDMLALGPHASSVTIKFRILKVSRNFDNARFVLDISPDYSKVATKPPVDEQLAGVRTFPILVRSKRRRTQASSSSSSSSSAVAMHAHADDSDAYDSVHSGGDAVPPRLGDHGRLGSSESVSILRTLLAGQQQQSMLLQQVLNNQRAIMARVEEVAEASGMGHSDVLGPYSRSVGIGAVPPAPLMMDPMPGAAPFLPTDPPAPGKNAFFRREGTNSSVGSTATTASDPSLAMPELLAFDASGRAIATKASAAVPASSSSSSSSSASASIASAGLPSTKSPVASSPAALLSGSAMDHLAAVAAAENVPKRTRTPSGVPASSLA